MTFVTFLSARATFIFNMLHFHHQGNRTYGVVELSLWLVRVLSNVRNSFVSIIIIIIIIVVVIVNNLN